MADKRTGYENFDDLLSEPFERIDRMVTADPIERCDRMIRRLEVLESELTRFLELALIPEDMRNQ